MNEDIIKKELLKELGLENLPQDKQEQLLVKMTETLLKRIFVETMGKLNEADQKAYVELSDRKPAPEEIEKFLTEKISGYESFVQSIIVNFKKEITTEV
ncbi:MAG: hypothetical protein COU40_00700 [Candidatus Moranbacteria bacterium CG10_big_fil_rev_8_21_14_0_10_35_21]|nr:MAG: hypothetical protein COU40_00700 [Candidatus Moranbacteria bacterium CG10_big_fil_rev_8_21_14_0_10_35_21]